MVTSQHSTTNTNLLTILNILYTAIGNTKHSKSAKRNNDTVKALDLHSIDS